MTRIRRAAGCGLVLLACWSTLVPLHARTPVVVPADAPRSQLDRDETSDVPAMKYIKPHRTERGATPPAPKRTVVKPKPATPAPKDASH